MPPRDAGARGRGHGLRQRVRQVCVGIHWLVMKSTGARAGAGSGYAAARRGVAGLGGGNTGSGSGYVGIHWLVMKSTLPPDIYFYEATITVNDEATITVNDGYIQMAGPHLVIHAIQGFFRRIWCIWFVRTIDGSTNRRNPCLE
jgi:hypothetical protein